MKTNDYQIFQISLLDLTKAQEIQITSYNYFKSPDSKKYLTLLLKPIVWGEKKKQQNHTEA